MKPHLAFALFCALFLCKHSQQATITKSLEYSVLERRPNNIEVRRYSPVHIASTLLFRPNASALSNLQWSVLLATEHQTIARYFQGANNASLAMEQTGPRINTWIRTFANGTHSNQAFTDFNGPAIVTSEQV